MSQMVVSLGLVYVDQQHGPVFTVAVEIQCQCNVMFLCLNRCCDGHLKNPSSLWRALSALLGTSTGSNVAMRLGNGCRFGHCVFAVLLKHQNISCIRQTQSSHIQLSTKFFPLSPVSLIGKTRGTVSPTLVDISERDVK